MSRVLHLTLKIPHDLLGRFTALNHDKETGTNKVGLSPHLLFLLEQWVKDEEKKLKEVNHRTP